MSEHSIRFVYGLIPLFSALISLMYRVTMKPNLVIYFTLFIAIIWSAYEIYYAYFIENIYEEALALLCVVSFAFGANLGFFLLTWNFNLEDVLNDKQLVISGILYIVLGLLLNFSKTFKELIKKK